MGCSSWFLASVALLCVGAVFFVILGHATARNTPGGDGSSGD